MPNSVKGQAFKSLLRLGVLLFISLFAATAQAVIAVDNVSTVVDNNPTTLTRSHTTNAGSDRLMLVGVSLLNEDLETVSSVTYNGTGLNFVGQVSQGNDSRVEIWAYLNPPVTTANVVVTFNEQVQLGAIVGIVTFTGVNQTSPYGAFQSNTGDSTTATATASSASGDLVFGVMAAERQDSGPVVVGGTARWTLKSQNGNNRTAGAGATFSGAASVNLRWNMNETDDWAIGAISLRDVNAPAATGFCDDFESGLGNWAIDTSGGGSAGINGATFNSAANSLYTRWDPVSVTSNLAIDASGKPYQLSLWIRRGDDSFSENPEAGEDLQVQYFNNVGSWITLETFVGNDTPGQVYERSYPLPADAQHGNLRVRLTQTGGSGIDWDYWHVDDVCLLEVVQPEIEFRMDELSWNGAPNEVVDSSGNGNNANANAASGLTTINPGQICRAGDFDGTDDYIESNDIYPLLGNTASMSFWIRTTQTGNNLGWQAPGIAGIEEAGGADDIFWGWLDAGGRIGISVGNDYSTKSTVAINDGSYHHVVLTRDATTGDYKIYIDGILDASGSSTAGIIGNSFSSIGRIEDTGGTPVYFQGELDELLVFNSVLSDSAVTSIYSNQANGRNIDGSNRNCAGSLAWFRLDADAGVWNGSAGEVVDQSGNFTGAAALGTGAGVDSVLAQVCRGIDIPFNNSNGAQYGFDSGIDVDADVGNLGSINFWYNSDNNWVGGGNRMLVDASPDDLPGADKYFYVVLLNNGRLRFALEDSSDADFSFQTGVNAIAGGVWTHIAVTWDMSGNREIYINGALAATDTNATNGQLAALRSLYFGDNRSSYHPGATANSADGIIDEVRVYDRVQTAGEIITDLNATHSCAGSLTDHLSITHDGSAINCQPESITISAHTATGPHDVDIAYTGIASLSVDTLHGDWSYVSGGNPANLSNSGNGNASYTFDGTENGSVVLALYNTFAETIDIDVSDGTYTESSGTADASDDPPLTYAPAGFNFLVNGLADPIGTQISGKASNLGHGAQTLELQAINTNDDTGVCEAVLAGTVDVEIAFQCENANTCQRPIYVGGAGPSTQVNGTNTDVVTPLVYTDVSLDFGTAADTTADLVLNYPDAGQIRLHARYALPPSGEDLIGASNSFVVRPFGFDINVPHPSTHATTHAGDVLASAGSAFTVSAAAVLWNSADDDLLGTSDGSPDNHDDTDPVNNDVLSGNSVILGGISYTGTPNFGQENEDIELTSLLLAPAGGTDPGLPVNTLIMSFVAGAGSNPNVVFNEVGIIEIAASVAGLDYLGTGAAETALMTSKSGYVGRFNPASLSISAFVNGDFSNANPSGAIPFTYIGQGFTYDTNHPAFTVSALNVGGGVTMNYTDNLNVGDNWAKLSAGSVNFTSPTADNVQDGTDGLTRMAISYTEDPLDFIMTDNGNGTHEFEFRDDSYVYDKDSNSLVAPFSSDISLVINSVQDGDSVATVTGVTLTPNPVDLRFGRLRMENAFGSELGDLIMNYHIEFFDLIGATPFWTRHHDVDTTTMLGDINAVPGNTAATSINPTFPLGKFEITLSAPGIEVTETITNLVDTSGEPWLQFDWDQDGLYDNNPSALATFGIFEGDPVQIYIQQIYE